MLTWHVRGLQDSRGAWQVTLVLANTGKPSPGRDEAEQATFFQTTFRVALSGARFLPRHPRQSSGDEDANTNNLIYRDAKEWAVGHTCSATWPDSTTVEWIEATWLPVQLVRSVNADGHPLFSEASVDVTGSPAGAFQAARLAQEPSAEALERLLDVTPAAYLRWLEATGAQIETQSIAGTISAADAAQARLHHEAAIKIAGRMQRGVELIRQDDICRRAFQLAQQAMLQQRRWSVDDPAADLRWRPFQLGFQLLALAGLHDPSGAGLEDRRTMDLLWFPTGGGKTEAYLGLTAFTVFLRRLRNANPDDGAGVAVLMRYTLRLLTVQQFERASRLILACELIRRRAIQDGDRSLGNVPFSIGLWVGSGATPNKIRDARDKADEGLKAKQLAKCPACSQQSLEWDGDRRSQRYCVYCRNQRCAFYNTELPVATIDEEIYFRRPSLLLGTADKFAQIVRKEETAGFFPATGQPPDLIIQDELHLISGPLGTLAGLYEAAVDILCTKNGVPPKIIGSTATIRRAGAQVRSLFNRTVSQFPPPVLDATDSGFAVIDPTVPGRLYVGLTSAGRSPKFLLQAACASLLQSAQELRVSEVDRDPFWTLVSYFNSLRELGGALVMMYDDVPDSVKLYAGLHGTPARAFGDEVQELTSRIESKEIAQVLDRLAVNYPAQQTAVVLATNMLSVGIDIPRFGLMVVNGQPKSMSEYIQATSRVGRNRIPGLVFTLYNAGRPRDRSHYEAFRTWHQTLYREVEATSVTPFAPRARDRALHAPVVAIARHRVPGMLSNPILSGSKREALDELIVALHQRMSRILPEEADDALAEIRDFLDGWEAKGDLLSYWDDWKKDTSLLISAERAATIRALRGAFAGSARATPNSLRDVEPSVTVRIT